MEKHLEYSDIYEISWKDYSDGLIHNLSNFLKRESYCDTTIICEGKHIKVHRIVLASCSDYFREIFDSIFCTHPFIILKDVRLIELEALIDFMYKGKTNIFKSRVRKLFKAAKYLQIKGLGVPDNELQTPPIKISTIDNNDKSGDQDKPTEDDESVPVASNINNLVYIEKENGNKRNDNAFSSVIQDKTPKKISTNLKRKISHKTSAPITHKKKHETLNLQNDASVSDMDVETVEKSQKLKPIVLLKRNIQSQVSNDTGDMIVQQSVSQSSNSFQGFSLSHKNKKYKCSDCPFNAKSPTGLVSHKKKHTKLAKAKQFKCSHCSYTTTCKELLSCHMKGHKSLAQPYRCTNCSFRTSLVISLNKHQEKFCKGKMVKDQESLSNDTANKNFTSNYQGKPSISNSSSNHQGIIAINNSPLGYQDKTPKYSTPSEYGGIPVKNNALQDFQVIYKKKNTSQNYLDKNTPQEYLDKNTPQEYLDTTTKINSSSCYQSVSDDWNYHEEQSTKANHYSRDYQGAAGNKNFVPIDQSITSKRNCSQDYHFMTAKNISLHSYQDGSAKSLEDVEIIHGVSTSLDYTDKTYQCTQYNSAKGLSSQNPQDKADAHVSSQDYIDETSLCLPSLDYDDNTVQDISLQPLQEKEYFLCAFCPHKTNKRSLLASHVAAAHQDLQASCSFAI